MIISNGALSLSRTSQSSCGSFGSRDEWDAIDPRAVIEYPIKALFVVRLIAVLWRLSPPC